MRKVILFKVRIIAVLASVCLLCIPCVGREVPKAQTAFLAGGVESDNLLPGQLPKYNVYLREHMDKPVTADELDIPFDSLRVISGQAELLNGLEGYTGAVLMTGENSDIELSFYVPESAMYSILADYFPVEGTSGTIERSLYIDGERPFKEAVSLSLPRVFVDESIRRDREDNDIRPLYSEDRQWRTQYLQDQSGFYSSPYLFYLPKGQHTIRLESIREPCAFRGLTLCAAKQPAAYEDYLKEHRAAGAVDAVVSLPEIQAETMYRKSDYSIYPGIDRSSSSTTPVSDFKLRYNHVPSDKFTRPGQWISWEFDVEQSGFYKIAVRFKQDARDGGYVSRRVVLDGEVPFKEAEAIRFYYDREWQNGCLGGDLLFYLSEGRHVLEMHVVLGDMASLVSRTEDLLLALNACYREIVMVTGVSPDQFRDYYFEDIIPDTLEKLAACNEALKEISATLEAQVEGTSGSFTSSFNKVSFDIDAMLKKPKAIVKKLDSFKSNIGALGSWILDCSFQPLSLDFIQPIAPSQDAANINDSFFKGLVHQYRLFISSYINDYSSVSRTQANNDTIKVWIDTGRDQALIIRQLIGDVFVPRTNISAHLQLVSSGTLLRSLLADMGPDVALSQQAGEPINYAIRGAAVDLSGMPGFSEVAARFSQSALLPFTYRSKCYALPETFTFPMMFYREDILRELEIPLPKTWDDLYDVIVQLNINQMEFGLPGTFDSFLMLLYQQNQPIYNEDFTGIAFDNQTGLRMFNQWCQYYVSQGFSVQYDFVNRFRTGETPIGIAEFSTTYNQLSVFAPEIKGLWSMTEVPGTLLPDGSVSHAVASSGTGCIMLTRPGKTAGDDRYNSSWEFMKWWTDAETQVKYGKELEAVMGVAARYPTANTEAVKQIGWPVKDYASIMAQWQDARGVPQCPGSYITERYINFAFKYVVNNNVDSGRELLRYSKMINKELIRKQKEFDFQ